MLQALVAKQRERKEKKHHYLQEQICPFPYRSILIWMDRKGALFIFTFYFWKWEFYISSWTTHFVIFDYTIYCSRKNRTYGSFTQHGTGTGTRKWRVSIYYTMYCTHYTGTGTRNHCFLLCLSLSLSRSRPQGEASLLHGGKRKKIEQLAQNPKNPGILTISYI